MDNIPSAENPFAKPQQGEKTTAAQVFGLNSEGKPVLILIDWVEKKTATLSLIKYKVEDGKEKGEITELKLPVMDMVKVINQMCQAANAFLGNGALNAAQISKSEADVEREMSGMWVPHKDRDA